MLQPAAQLTAADKGWDSPRPSWTSLRAQPYPAAPPLWRNIASNVDSRKTGAQLLMNTSPNPPLHEKQPPFSSHLGGIATTGLMSAASITAG